MGRTKGKAKSDIQQYTDWVYTETYKILGFVDKGNTTLEIGMGSGRMLVTMAEKDTEEQFFGIELKEERCWRMAKKAKNRGLSNIACFCGTFDNFLDEALNSGLQFKTIWITFPDPWPKKRHEMNRFVTYHSYQDIMQLLTPGGSLFFKTDHKELFAYTYTIFRHSPFEVNFATEDLYNSTFDKNIPTDFEERYIKEGRTIHLLEVKNVLLHSK